MILKQKLFTVTMLVSVGLSALFVTAPAYAQGTGSGGDNFFSGLVSFIAQKFGLEKSQVQSAITDYHSKQKTKNQINMQEREKIRLDMLVTQGKITTGQETAIKNELTALKAKYAPVQGDTFAQRKSKMQSLQADLKAWAASNKIDMQYIQPFGFKRGMGHKGFGRWESVTPTVTP